MKVQRLAPTKTTPFHAPKYRTAKDAAAAEKGAPKAPESPLEREFAARATISLILPVPPPLNNLYATVKRRDGKLSRIKSSAGKKYDADVKALLKNRAISPIKGAVCLMLRVFRARKAGDLDNYSKGCLDSLKGICWHDDKQIEEIHSYRYDDAKNPRVEVEIWEKL